MREIDRLAAIHADDPTPQRVGKCRRCRGFFRLVDGRLPEHSSRFTGDPCDCQVLAEEEPPMVGFDHDPGVYYGGLPTLGKDR